MAQQEIKRTIDEYLAATKRENRARWSKHGVEQPQPVREGNTKLGEIAKTEGLRREWVSEMFRLGLVWRWEPDNKLAYHLRKAMTPSEFFDRKQHEIDTWQR